MFEKSQIVGVWKVSDRGYLESLRSWVLCKSQIVGVWKISDCGCLASLRSWVFGKSQTVGVWKCLRPWVFGKSQIVSAWKVSDQISGRVFWKVSDRVCLESHAQVVGFLKVSDRYVSSSMVDFEHKLKSVWFTTYPRSGSSRTLDSSGFEHVFVGEVKGSSVDGFHNWIQFYLEEKKGHANYLGYVFKHQPGILGVHFKWYSSYKKQSSLIVGSSPEFEMACYTLCYYLHRNRDCQFNINGHTIRVKTYEVDNMPGDQIATAYL
ncbi:ENDOU [Mytilus edulis]|uniref:Uridylate-specific endoribonuclease n=1 Tax=Mytilus edulis TaxID=6550 RepID=A0A8S3V8F8_MYTED|nr:ENDOU [Mytilus edulis]